MPTLTTGNMLIAQSGGPSAVINQSLVGAVIEARKRVRIRSIFGARHGIQGVLSEDLVDLRKETQTTLEAVARTPSSALGSVRKKPAPEDCAKIFEVLRKRDVRYFFYIGGNDSAETAHIISQEAGKTGFDLRCFHIPKTIDNDLKENDHTPGYGSAAQFVACAMMGIDLDNRALPGAHISVVMGRGAGFLTAAGALARARPDDGPHLIYLPEWPFSPEQFLKDVEAVHARLGRCMVAVSEGIKDKNGAPIAGLFLKETDSHGNAQLSGSGALGDMLADLVKSKTAIKRARADTFGYLQRSFPLTISAVDAREARQVGALAVRHAMKSDSGSIAILRKPGKKYQVYYERVPLQNVARETRHMPDAFISPAGNDVTPAFLDYARPLVGALPRAAYLKAAPAPNPRISHSRVKCAG
ncbi:MAG: 6-phosphofructokinase [Verrucomicrobiota bacterium]|nr:6-phosphofructokinase [Verrucomicrobiota bacterium]